MMQYWNNLQAREQRTLLLGAVAALLLGIYALVIDPFTQKMAQLEQRVVSDRELLVWMEQSAAQVEALRRSGGAKRSSGKSLLSLVDSSAKRNGLGAALKQVKPEGNGVRLRFEQAGFDDMLRWLGRLDSEHGVGVSSLNLERLDEAGKVNASVVLERGA